MANFKETGPSNPTTEATRVDKITPRYRLFHNLRAIIVILIAIVLLIPIFVMVITAFKTRQDIVSTPPSVVFSPTLEGFVYLFTERAVASPARLQELKNEADAGQMSLFERIALSVGQEITDTSDYVDRLKNSLIIAGLSTIASVILAVFAAYAFSRYQVKGKNDLLFFILSTRMLPAVVVTIPLFLMYTQVKLHDTHIGMILLYTVFNLSLAVWLMKGFMDEIPLEYEEAALVDGYTRMQAFFRIVLPQAVTGIAATTVFCLIFSWNEYAFALMLTSETARTAPPSIATMLGRGGIEWSAIAVGSLGFLIPVIIVVFLLRNYLLRGVTFGAVRK
ncbi:MAG: carbohydrate ABC transporter permease [Chloroflexota bacterium]|nr:MAG: carbohydrate ABC transporter permease [Chloroflexota bacterium]